MEQSSKPFLSKNNPLNMSIDDGEKFSFNYLLPIYWFTWLLIFFSFILSYSPKFFRALLGSFVGILIYHFNNKRRNISKKNLSLCFKKMSSQDLNNLLSNSAFRSICNQLIDSYHMKEEKNRI